MFNPFLFVLGIMAIIFSVPIVAIWTEHRRKVMEMQLRAQSAPNEKVESRLQELRREIADLRATSTEYDLSFDSALERMESRIAYLEQRVQWLEGRMGTPVATEEQEIHNTAV